MAYDRFLIAPFESGLETDLRPWLIPDDAFAELQNAYIFRGRVRKRFGSRLMGYGWASANPETAPLFSRLRINLGNTNGAGVAAGFAPGTKFKAGQQFSVGNVIFTVPATGAPVNMLRTDASVEAATYNTTTGAYSITIAAAPATAVWFYPAEPVMGLSRYGISAINNKPSYAFDTQFAYQFAGGFWTRAGTAVWAGTNANFFWCANWMGITSDLEAMFVSNFTGATGLNAVNDPIRTLQNATWFDFTPQFLVDANPAAYTVKTAKIIIPFKNRLLLMDTIENGAVVAGDTTSTRYQNRCRYSANASPFAGGGTASTTAWLEVGQVGATGASYADAPVDEAIMSAEFIKDHLIVYFERSTWEFAYTGNEVMPFRWQKLNTELGSQAKMSTVPFDKVVLTVSNTGLTGCNGLNVERVDTKIPQQVFQIRNDNNGVDRVAGIRDYFTELVYWTFPAVSDSPSVYPNQVLVYNYRNGSWALNDDCITAFDYFEQQQDRTWTSTNDSWENANYDWISGVQQANFRQVIAGNQQGYVFVVDSTCSRNAPVMQISNIINNGGQTQLRIIDHTLVVGDYIKIENALGVVINGTGIYQVIQYIDTNNVIIDAPVIAGSSFAGVYRGGGSATRVPIIQISSKQWNPYTDKGRGVSISQIVFGVESTPNGQVTVDVYPNDTYISMLAGGQASGAAIGSGVLETSPYALVPLEANQDSLWHPMYFQADGQSIQLYISMSDTQLKTSAIVESDFQLNGLILYTMPTSMRMQ